MIKEITRTDIAFRYTILQLLFLVLGLLLVYLFPVFLIVIPLFPLLLISYVCGIISTVHLIKGRKELSSNKSQLCLLINSTVLVLLTILAIYTLLNQTVF